MIMDLNVAATLKVMPESPDADMKSIEKSLSELISKYGKVHSVEIKPIAFGLKAIEVVALLSDKEGGMDAIEAGAANIKGVGSVEITDVNRL